MDSTLENELTTWMKVLEELRNIPMTEHETTFMEVCRIGRFEETCSRILQFFLSPMAEHGMRGLFLRTFLELSGNGALEFDATSISVRTEEMTKEGKRIDILVESPDFVISIENKINAELYNPINLYRDHIREEYNKDAYICIVLSARRLSPGERRKAEANSHVVIYYEDLFNAILSKVGHFMLGCNPKWLNFLQDFIKTINNRMSIYGNTEEYHFFTKHRAEIDSLIGRYELFKQQILKEQTNAIPEIKRLVDEKTSTSWWVYNGWDLGFSFNVQKGQHRIGIESWFSDNAESSLGEFHIYITTWNRNDWPPYEAEARRMFPEHTQIRCVANRVYMDLPIIINGSLEQIAQRLSDTYFRMKEICSKIS